MDIIPTPKKNVVLDATMLSTLMSCGRLTDLRFNHHLKAISGKSVSLEMGSTVHTYLETYYKFVIEGSKRDDAHGFAMATALAYTQGSEVQNCTDEDKKLAIDTCEEYFQYYRNDFWTPLEVEVVKGEVVYEDDVLRIMWKAKYDLLADTNKGIFPMDHKTMKQRRDTSSLNNQFIGQCLLAKTTMMFVNKVGFQKSLKPVDRFTRVPVTYTKDRINEWQTQILPYWASMMLMYDESGYWPPNFTHCENKYGFCQFRHTCEVDRNMREQTLGMDFIVGEPWSI